MGFKFDDEDDELSLDLGKDAAKTQNPAPLPKTVKPTGESLSKLPKPGQKAQPKSVESPAQKTGLPKQASTANKPVAPKIPSKPTNLTTPVEEVQIEPVVKTVKPVAKPVTKNIEPVLEQVSFDDSSIDDMYEEESIPSYYEEPVYPEPTAVTNQKPQPELNRSSRRTRSRKTYVENGVFQPESENILTTQETNSTFKKKSPFDGDRKRIMRIRVAATSVVVVLMAAGIYSFIPKPGFKDDVSQINAAITYANKYDAIKTATENYALRFTTDFLNRTEVTENTRQQTMQTYMDLKTISAVDFTLNKVPAQGEPNGVNIYMKILSGPYIYSINNIDAAKIQSQRINEGNGYIYSIVTATYVQPYIASSDFGLFGADAAPLELTPKWVYLSVPVMHDYETKQTTIYGFPSFYTPEKNSWFR